MPRVNSDEELKRYRDFLKDNNLAKPMQDPSRAKVKKNWTQDLIYYEENNQIKAAMSVIGIKNSNGKYFLYAPRGPVCDFSDFDLVEALIKEADFLKEKYDPFLLRMDPEVVFDERLILEYRKRGYDFRSFGEPIHSFTQPRYNMILDLEDKDEDEIFSSFSTKCRYNIRKSYRSGVETILETSEKSLDIFYKLTEIMAERQGIGHRPKDYFQRLVAEFDGKIFTSYFEGEALSSSIIIPYNNKAYYLYAASSNENRKVMPNYNMIWEEIKWTKEHGYRYFDFGGVFSLDKSDGLYMFKEHFLSPHKYTNFIGELDIVYDRQKYEEFLKQ